MKEIGNLLKGKREELRLSYDDVHKVIKIQEKYLKAIEDGDIEAFFAPIYYKSFVRSYSKFLGFDPEKTVSMINMSVFQEFANNKKKYDSTKENTSKSYFDIKKMLITLVILVTIVLVVFIISFNRKTVAINSEIENLEYVKLDEKVQSEKNQSLTKNQFEESSELAKQQEIEVIAIEIVWIQLDVDGKTIYEGTLNKGQKKIWKSNKIFKLKIGYAPGLKVLFNGQEIDVVKNALKDVNTVILQ